MDDRSYYYCLECGSTQKRKPYRWWQHIAIRSYCTTGGRTSIMLRSRP